jgi:hypothetical protein
MFRHIPPAIVFLCCLLSMVAGQVPPNPNLDPISQVETNGRRAEREFRAGTVPSGRANTIFRPYLIGRSSGEMVRVSLKTLPASTADLRPYRSFLKAKNTGVTRLLSESDCMVQNDGRLVFNSLCPQLVLPDGGGYYSFRRSQYISKYLSDLGFVAGNLVIRGLFEQGILVDLGSEDIEKVGINHDAAISLLAFRSASSTDEGDRQNLELESGVRIGERIFKRRLPVHEGTTYLARFIAFRGPGHKGGVTDEVTNVLKRDSRADIIVVFRVVAVETDGSATIIWKQLVRRPSPILELSLKEKNGHQQ